MDAKLFTTAELIEYLSLPRSTLYRLIANGQGPRRLRAGGTNRFRKADVDAWLEAQADGGPKAKAS